MANNATDMAAIEEQLAAALLAKEAAEAELAASQLTSEELAEQRRTLDERLAEALIARQALESQVDSLSQTTTETAQQRADLEARLAEALAAAAAARADAATQLTEAEQQAALLAAAQLALSEEEQISSEAQRQVAVLNENVNALRRQVSELQQLLNLANEVDAQNEVQISNLSQELNQALARAAAENARRLQLEEAERRRLEEERARLEAEAQDLEQYRSEFFGRMREVLADEDGIRIEGDRFVFSSEVLFPPAGAELSPQGEAEIAKVAGILRRVASEIPDGIDWIIRVDGHTDNVPLSGTGTYANNWELSQARALSVVLFMIEQEGIPPQRLAANGFGEYQPLNPADDDAARAQNRRIELKLTER
jgi:chemotaxis protein MotB